MIALEFEQRSPEWFAARCGIPTASSFDKIITPTGKASTQAEAYGFTVLAERLTGYAQSWSGNQWTERGAELEDEARGYYEFVTGRTVQPVGFCLTDDRMVGCSPDGLIGEDGALELKCPKPETHVKYLLKGGMVSDYIPQVQGQLYVTGRQWVDFVSYCRGIEALIVRVARDQAYIDVLAKQLLAFNVDLKAKETILRAKGYMA